MRPGTVLITGGAGYIGSHATLELMAGGAPVVALDNLSTGRRELVPEGVPFEHCDLLDRAGLERVFRRYSICAVIHFAARAYVEESARDPARYFENNFIGTFHLLEAMRSFGVANIVFSSTCAIYGEPAALPIAESAPKAPVNPYGESKLAVERMLDWYERAYRLRAVALRYFNAAGADAAGRAGECHDPEPHLIPRLLDACEGSGPALRICGGDYPTPDGSCVRDYIHVSDLARAHALALQHLEAGGEALRLNLGTGQGVSVRQLAAAARKLTGGALRCETGPRRAGDPAALVADASAAKAALGWEPEQSGTENLLSTAWRWSRAWRARRRKMAA